MRNPLLLRIVVASVTHKKKTHKEGERGTQMYTYSFKKDKMGQNFSAYHLNVLQ